VPYIDISELPPGIRKLLPRHAQEIFVAAYNNAWEEYQNPIKRRGNTGIEEVARRVAWAAVKKEFTKDPESGKWEAIFNHR
jgi:cation transport regulator